MKKLTSLVLIPVLALFAVPALAEMYKWTDANGQVHFGDKPPAGSRNAVNLSPPPVNIDSSRPAEPKAAPDNSSRQLMERQKRLSDIIKQEAEEREAAAQQAEKEKAERQRNCGMLRGYQKAMNGVPIYNLDEKGERIYLTDQQRSELESDINNRIGENCE